MSEAWKCYDCYSWIFEGHITLEPVEKDKSKQGERAQNIIQEALRGEEVI